MTSSRVSLLEDLYSDALRQILSFVVYGALLESSPESAAISEEPETYKLRWLSRKTFPQAPGFFSFRSKIQNPSAYL